MNVKCFTVSAAILLAGSFTSVDKTIADQPNIIYYQEPQDEEAINVEALPKAVSDALKGKEYAGWEVVKAYRINNASNADEITKKAYYHLVLEKDGKTKSMYLNSDGKNYQPEIKG